MRIIIDTETTGLNTDQDEILQLAILDADTGAMLYNQYYKPLHHEEWPEAQAVNGISPEFVSGCKPITSDLYRAKIQDILNQAEEIIGYNTRFDLAMLRAAGYNTREKYVKVRDAMGMYAAYHGEWSEKHGGYKYKSLIFAAQDLGYVWQGAAHDALGDCLATRYVYQEMCEQIEQKEAEIVERIMRCACMLIGTGERINRCEDPDLIFPAHRALEDQLRELQLTLEGIRDGNPESV